MDKIGLDYVMKSLLKFSDKLQFLFFAQILTPDLTWVIHEAKHLPLI